MRASGSDHRRALTLPLPEGGEGKEADYLYRPDFLSSRSARVCEVFSA
jgi:hypothetical protein